MRDYLTQWFWVQIHRFTQF